MDHRERRSWRLDLGWTPSQGVLTDAALAAMVMFVGTVAIAADLGVQTRSDGAAYVCLAGLAALLFVRRRFPVVVLAASAVGIVAYHAAGFPPIGLALPVAAALYSAAEAGRVAWAVAIGATLVVFATVVRLLTGDSVALVLGYELGVNTAVVAAAVALGDGVRARRLWRAEQRERAREAVLEREREAARRVQEERLRIARELHDVLAHTAAVISLHTDVASEALAADDPAAAGAALEEIRIASRNTMRELRTTVGLLRGSEDDSDPPGELGQLDQLVRTTTAGGLPVAVEVHGARPSDLPAVVDAAAYRIVQEALTNALRHARARRAHVVIHYAPDRVEVRVSDDGRGCGGAPRPGHGLTGMRERAALLGGTVRAGDRAGGGFEVEAILPLVPS